MLDLLQWLVVSSLLGVAVMPLLFVAFPNLTDRGYGFARALGLLVVGALVWFLSLLHIIPSDVWSWWTITAIVGVAGWSLMLSRHRDEMMSFLKRRWVHMLTTEALFLLFFLGFALYKFHDADVLGTEKPMDLTMLNAVISASYAPPGDLWLSGFPISYYYFGYWMFGGLTQMSGVAAEVGFNLAAASIAGMGAAAIFCLTSNLVRRDGGSTGLTIAAGVTASFLLLAISNLNGFWELISLSGIGTDGFYEWLAINGVDKSDPGAGWRPSGFWWWWASSRVINTFDTSGEVTQDLDFTIQEFPFFSLMLGDLHPHVMSIPFVVAGLGMVANVYFSQIPWGVSWLIRNRVSTLLLVLMVGASGFINAWDLALLGSVLALVVFMKSYRENGRDLRRAIQVAILPASAIFALGAAFFFNYYFVTLQSQIQWPPIAPARLGTRPIHFLTVWGGLMSVAIVFLTAYVAPMMLRERRRVAAVRAETKHPLLRHDFTPWIVSGLIVAGTYLLWIMTHYGSDRFIDETDLYRRLVLAGPLGIVFMALFVTTYNRGIRGADDGANVALLLATYAFLVIFGAELFFVHDFFANRMNTIFKFYYQSWIILSAVGGYGVYHWLRNYPYYTGYRRVLSGAAAMIALLLFAISLYYPLAASVTKTGESHTRASLDGLTFLENNDQGVRDALSWIRSNIDEDEVLIEGVGGSYTEFGRYSGFTGAQSVLGWTGHQRQWRGDSDLWKEREEDIDRLYREGSGDEIITIADRYSADYIVVGPAERRKYTGLNESKFDQVAERVYENEQVTIYALRK